MSLQSSALEVDTYSERNLNGLIAENIHLLRNLIGDTLDDVYEEEFGKKYDAAEHGAGADGEALSGPARARARRTKGKVLGQRQSDLETALDGKLSETRRLEDQFERRKQDAETSKYQYDALCSEFAKNE
eukprot:CAMPEP_0198459428 /NCGR_PEP_ID=MMETSP1453-20131121/40873_1 /TAXON_ID=1461543 ORGANISM="Unidentified sp., Strain RCC701" /NCGR_SAMPLE_ID=MMETSP1453 /ASSEMBLY_ACC=CAM_ASM_001118 /LENGTH=129 /DNA_ID=CAMNT_0044184403 /DNA_START=389 /DNA_END=775 /DNA_ORIENTATION=-